MQPVLRINRHLDIGHWQCVEHGELIGDLLVERIVCACANCHDKGKVDFIASASELPGSTSDVGQVKAWAVQCGRTHSALGIPDGLPTPLLSRQVLRAYGGRKFPRYRIGSQSPTVL